MANQLGGSTSGINSITSGTPFASSPAPALASAPSSSGGGSGLSLPSSVYWTGANGNTYVKSSGVQGVQDYGKLASGANIAGSKLISDPNAPSSGSGTPTTSGSGTSTAAADANFNDQKNSTLSSIKDSIGSNAGDFGGSIQDYVDQRQQSQNSINNDSVQNELSREQGQQGVLDMVGNGIKSGGVTLANNNAGSSSAGEALARAYGILGRQQSSQVGNQFAQGQNKVNTEENNLVAGDTTEARHVTQSKTDTINNIVNNARTQLANLNYYAASGNVNDRVDIENQIAQVKQQAIDALSAYDGTLSKGISGQTPQSAAGIRSTAQGLLTAGTAPESQFNYTTTPPPQLQGTGQFASDLPIFVSPNKNNNQT